MKIDNTAAIYNVIDINPSVSTKQAIEAKATSSTKTVEFNEHDQTLINESRSLVDDSSAVDVDKITAIKAQIQSGQLQFNMKELAKALTDLGS